MSFTGTAAIDLGKSLCRARLVIDGVPIRHEGGGAPGLAARDGEAGGLLIAGTGAMALGVNAGSHRSVDGWGPDLGDLGSGSWIGREGVRAVLRARDGLGPATVLTAALAVLIGTGESPITWVGGAAAPARLLATVAPAGLDAADQGDAVATGIRDGAVMIAEGRAPLHERFVHRAA